MTIDAHIADHQTLGDLQEKRDRLKEHITGLRAQLCATVACYLEAIDGSDEYNPAYCLEAMRRTSRLLDETVAESTAAARAVCDMLDRLYPPAWETRRL